MNGCYFQHFIKVYDKIWVGSYITRFFYKQHFYKQRQAEIGKKLKKKKKKKNAKQHPQVELLLFENYSHFWSMLSSKSDRTYSKK